MPLPEVKLKIIQRQFKNNGKRWVAMGGLCIGYEKYDCILKNCSTPHNRLVTHNDYLKHSYGEHDNPSQGVVRWKEGEVLLDKEKSMVMKMAMWFRRYQRDIYSSPEEAFWISFANPEHGIQVYCISE